MTPPARAVVLDLTPRQVLAIAGDRLPSGYRRQLEGYRYGPGVFKVDWALDGPIPWRDPQTLRAGTVHLGGSMREVASSEDAVGPTIADPSRAPAGKHVAWAYCHVPNGSTSDMTSAIEARVERFAPGFRDLVLARATKDAPAMEAYDANYVGGDINGGIGDWRQLLFTGRRAVPGFLVHATGRRGPRDERDVRRAGGGAGTVPNLTGSGGPRGDRPLARCIRVTE